MLVRNAAAKFFPHGCDDFNCKCFLCKCINEIAMVSSVCLRVRRTSYSSECASFVKISRGVVNLNFVLLIIIVILSDQWTINFTLFVLWIRFENFFKFIETTKSYRLHGQRRIVNNWKFSNKIFKKQKISSLLLPTCVLCSVYLLDKFFFPGSYTETNEYRQKNIKIGSVCYYRKTFSSHTNVNASAGFSQ